MAKIKCMKQLRERVLEAFENLENRKIDITEAVTIAKLSETVIAGLKSEMQYAVLTNQEPYIPFYEDNKLISHNEDKKLTKKYKKLT